MIDTDNVLELEYTHVAKILVSSDLLVRSEVDVYNAEYIWLNYNVEELNKFAKYILVKVRLALLSDQS